MVKYNSYCVVKSLHHSFLVVGSITSSLNKYQSNSKCDHNHYLFLYCKPSFNSSSTVVKRKCHYAFIIVRVDLPHFNTGRLTGDVLSDKV